MGTFEVIDKNMTTGDLNMYDLMDLHYVDADTNDDGEVTDVNPDAAGLTAAEADALAEAASQEGAMGGEGFYVKDGDGWRKADNMSGTFYMQSKMKQITDVVGSMTTGIAKEAEAAKTVISTFKQM